MYLIADNTLTICGVLSLDGKGCKFYNDIRSVSIADDQGKVWTDTLELQVPYGYNETDMMTEGYHLLKEYENGYWYCFRIKEWTDSAVGTTHTKKVSAINLAAWDFNKTIVVPTTFKNVKAETAYTHIAQRTGWDVNVEDNGTLKSFEITADSDSNAMKWLDELNAQYEKEIRAYVEIRYGRIFNKILEAVDELGEKTGRRIEYAKNMLGIERTGGDEQLFTKLHVYGVERSSGKLSSIASVNDGKPYIVDDDANDSWNGGGKYLEGWIKSEEIMDSQGLLYWGYEQMKYYNHPKYIYQIDVSQLDFDADLGDTLQVVDFEMQPTLTVTARVIQKDESEANPELNKVYLGEYNTITTVTPDLIVKLLAEMPKPKKNYKLELSTTTGTTFKNQSGETQIICRVYLDNQIVNVEPYQLKWYKILADGTHDVEWERSNVNVGSVITVTAAEVNQKATYQVELNIDEFVHISEEFFIKELEEVLTKLNAIADSNCLVIPFITDTHYATSSVNESDLKARSLRHITNVVELTHQSNCDCVVHGGDIVDGHSTKVDVVTNIKSVMDEISNSAVPYFLAKGNHDDNSFGDQNRYKNDMKQVIQPSEMHTLITKPSEKFGFVTNPSNKASYGYYDIQNKRTRLFVLNSYDIPYILANGKNKYPAINQGGFQQAQITWFAESLKSTPSEYRVLIFVHDSLPGVFGTSVNYLKNGDMIKAIISAYKNGDTVNMSSTDTDFKASINISFNGNREVIAILNGHYHMDFIDTTILNGIPCISVVDSLARPAGEILYRTVDTSIEDGWDVLVVNFKQRKINMVRFGAGNDREISY